MISLFFLKGVHFLPIAWRFILLHITQIDLSQLRHRSGSSSLLVKVKRMKGRTGKYERKALR